VLIPWGAALFANSPAWKDDGSNKGAEQAAQIGDNHDGMHFFPLDGQSNTEGLLVLNHEYNNGDGGNSLHARYGVGTTSRYQWDQQDARFDAGLNPNEPNRFGWILEVDPFEPSSTPKKRTALGRIKHENCAMTLSADKRVVVYMGDDQRGDYIYKFVSDGTYDALRKEHQWRSLAQEPVAERGRRRRRPSPLGHRGHHPRGWRSDRRLALGAAFVERRQSRGRDRGFLVSSPLSRRHRPSTIPAANPAVHPDCGRPTRPSCARCRLR
jgi:secreted PhoX family phosphatase